ncbi:bifunctional hydroxymethylpyrimidine kinase/phosphomethylpyrimidine kinase [Thiomicrospira microaerophila]|uniref:bifunctional hydroxymethylpyrimidine kinase/phosphomethylpyrimidine kinase n=1 Tax=Thiomicrospira microaerophila TaxID=406020 RepID=UPI00200DCF57|nr:bifunctional hydroxymethylpyrimidine kinase/phosphomethylpyrimidine kinase [Thiomicrospira microaerophila]UQB41967.1 bifunctional hydroxymethylpyrimidine kinase/phosphomethylpyrimidine kinase [Thiomicrospira microaerophila]
MKTIKNLLTIAGSDPSGGAGIQADLKAFSATGSYGMSVITGLTAQNTQGVQAIHPLPVEFVSAQLDSLFADIQIDGIKIGMLGSADMMRTIAPYLTRFNGPIVLDPVMVAKGGASLMVAESEQVLIDRLLPLAGLVTPNLPELAVLLGQPEAQNRQQMQQQAQALINKGAQAVLVKGGHLVEQTSTDQTSADFLLTAEGGHWFEAPRIDTANTHGTGCTLASAICSYWAQNCDLVLAVQRAKDYIQAAIEQADQLNVGKGHGPVNHFYRLL